MSSKNQSDNKKTILKHYLESNASSSYFEHNLQIRMR